MKELMLGNQAVARGLYEAGCRIVSSYPGTPSTEITEYAAEYSEMYSEWAPNEKVAAEVAFGASVAGARSFCGMKHVGLNVAADPVYTASYTGVNAGMVIGVADDPGMHSSQNEQDSRYHAIASKIVMLEPADAQECLDYTKLAFELSEEFDTPAMLRLTTRISHSRSIVNLGKRENDSLKEYKKDPSKYVMMPAMAKKRRVIVEERMHALRDWAETAEINKVIDNGHKVGVITAGICYQYAKEALGDKVSYLKLGCVNPLPEDLIRDFVADHATIYVIEELEDIIESHCKKMGLEVIGKEIFPPYGEFSQSLIREIMLNEKIESKEVESDVPARPPVLCPGCPHRGLYYALKRLRVFVSGDIGCYTLGALPPLSGVDTCICMGASISSLHGHNKAREGSNRKSVAVIGDSTFIHSGINSLINVAYNQGNSTVIVLDNSTTGMTGHQQNPTTGYTLSGDPTAKVNIEALCKAIGINRVMVVDPKNLDETQAVIKAELEVDEPSVIIARRPCVLLKEVKREKSLTVETDKCTGCTICMRIGCPAISMIDSLANIDETQCVGCDLCVQLCNFDAIVPKEGN